MKYETWLTYPDRSIGVHLKKDEYHCCEFGNNQETKQHLKVCTSLLELKFYLLSLPKPPKKEISALITKLEAGNK